MDFWLSKALWALLQPATLLTLGLALGVVALFLPWPRIRRCGRRLLAILVGLLLLVSLFPVERLVLAPLETRFPRPALPAEVDGIVVLGGGISFKTTGGVVVATLNESGGDRLLALMALADAYPEARLVFTGGSGLLRQRQYREADAAKALLEQVGFPTERVVFERRSRNTWENALFSQELVQPQAGETWILVTSAFHMPRAVGVFRQLGWEVVPWPVDYLAQERPWLAFDLDPLHALGTLTLATKEWIGLIAYHLMDRTPTLFPGPD